jgi:hypothetical protein
MKSPRVVQMTKLPLEHKGIYTPLMGNMVKTWIYSLRGHVFSTVRVLPTQAQRSHHVSPGIEASQRTRIPSPPIEPPVLVLWLHQVTRRISGKPPQTPRADSNSEPLPYTGSCPRLCLAFLATMWTALDPIPPPSPLSRAYLSLHSSEAPQG